MKLDLRHAAIVLLGAWNPAIFQPGWIVRHLFNVPEGQSVKGGQLIPSSPALDPILFLEGVGISVSGDRVRLYLNRFDEETISRVEKVAGRLVETLLHTPFGAFGVNFNFIEDDPDISLYDKLKVNDRLDQKFKIIKQAMIASIELDSDVTLNLSRGPKESGVVFDFNYHYKQINPIEFSKKISGLYRKNLERSKEILKDIYGLEEYSIINQTFDDAVEEARETGS